MGLLFWLREQSMASGCSQTSQAWTGSQSTGLGKRVRGRAAAAPAEGSQASGFPGKHLSWTWKEWDFRWRWGRRKEYSRKGE